MFALAAAQDYEAFYRQEILFRQVNLYPPFCDLLVVSFSSKKEEEARDGAAAFARVFAAAAAGDPAYQKLPIRLLGPAPDPLYKAAGKFRYRLTVKCRTPPPSGAGAGGAGAVLPECPSGLTVVPSFD